MANTSAPQPIVQNSPITVNPGVTPPVIVPPPQIYILTKFQFRSLFTLAERIAIDNAQYNPNLSDTVKATIATLQKDLDASGEVHLGTDPVTAGINYLVAVGLLAYKRAQRILSNLPPP